MTCCPTAFCRNCAIEWFKINVTCPICKKCSKSFAEENSLLVQKIEIKEINYTEIGNLFDNELYTIEDMHNLFNRLVNESDMINFRNVLKFIIIHIDPDETIDLMSYLYLESIVSNQPQEIFNILLNVKNEDNIIMDFDEICDYLAGHTGCEENVQFLFENNLIGGELLYTFLTEIIQRGQISYINIVDNCIGNVIDWKFDENKLLLCAFQANELQLISFLHETKNLEFTTETSSKILNLIISKNNYLLLQYAIEHNIQLSSNVDYYNIAFKNNALQTFMFLFYLPFHFPISPMELDMFYAQSQLTERHNFIDFLSNQIQKQFDIQFNEPFLEIYDFCGTESSLLEKCKLKNIQNFHLLEKSNMMKQAIIQEQYNVAYYICLHDICPKWFNPIFGAINSKNDEFIDFCLAKQWHLLVDKNVLMISAINSNNQNLINMF
jgi:hypothetical protein